jgi:transposase
LWICAAANEERQAPKRAALPARLPRRDVHREPEKTTCSCGYRMTRIGEDVSEKARTRSPAAAGP